MARQPLCTIVGMGPGLGLALADRFARAGFRIGMIARPAKSFDEAKALLAKIGVASFGISADAGSDISLTDGLKQLHGQAGNTEVLVYNAGAGRPARPSALRPDEAIADFRISAVGALVAIQQVAPAMIQVGKGTILLTGGIFALTPDPDFTSLG